MVQKKLKLVNKQKILQFLYKERESTKQEIANQTGISVPTVAHNIATLIEEGLVLQNGVADSTGGRKPLQIKFNPDARYSIGVEVEPAFIRVAFTNLDAKILEEQYLAQAPDPDLLLDHIVRMINEICQRSRIDRNKIIGVGLSFPGIVHEDTLVLEIAPNMFIQNMSLKTLEHRLKIPVYIENEANSSALAEHFLGTEKYSNNLIYLSISYGVGAGIIVGGKLYRGTNRSAGEFGHTTLYQQGRICNCGKQGCWERYTSQRSLLEDYAMKRRQDICSLDDYVKDLERGVPEAGQILDQYIEYMAGGLHNIILSLDPECVVIGGEIVALGDRLIEPVVKKLFSTSSMVEDARVKIMLSALGKDSPLLGAALLPIMSLSLM